MALAFYGHPFSSYTQKALIALYECGAEFDFKLVGSPVPPDFQEELKQLWPLGIFPVLTANGKTFIESSVIIEYLDLHHGGALIPKDPDAALDVRFLDRFFDNYVMNELQRLVNHYLGLPGAHDPLVVTSVRANLDKSYAWTDAHLQGRIWAAGERFSMADCAAYPALLYADWAYSIPAHFPNARAYLARLRERPSIQRVIAEAAPFKDYFPADPAKLR